MAESKLKSFATPEVLKNFPRFGLRVISPGLLLKTTALDSPLIIIRHSRPTEQVFRYIRGIQAGQVKTIDGRTIKVHPGTQYHCYIICDITVPLVAFFDDNNYASTPDKEAYYAYNDKLKAYVEVLSFNRLVSNSEVRNRVLFKSLGLLDDAFVRGPK